MNPSLRPQLPLKILESTTCNGKCFCKINQNNMCVQVKVEGNVEGNVSN